MDSFIASDAEFISTTSTFIGMVEPSISDKIFRSSEKAIGAPASTARSMSDVEEWSPRARDPKR